MTERELQAIKLLQELDLYLDFSQPLVASEAFAPANPDEINAVFARVTELLGTLEDDES